MEIGEEEQGPEVWILPREDPIPREQPAPIEQPDREREPAEAPDG